MRVRKGGGAEQNDDSEGEVKIRLEAQKEDEKVRAEGIAKFNGR